MTIAKMEITMLLKRLALSRGLQRKKTNHVQAFIADTKGFMLAVGERCLGRGCESSEKNEVGRELEG